jgi:hypothetical protein
MTILRPVLIPVSVRAESVGFYALSADNISSMYASLLSMTSIDA